MYRIRFGLSQIYLSRILGQFKEVPPSALVSKGLERGRLELRLYRPRRLRGLVNVLCASFSFSLRQRLISLTRLTGFG